MSNCQNSSPVLVEKRDFVLTYHGEHPLDLLRHHNSFHDQCLHHKIFPSNQGLVGMQHHLLSDLNAEKIGSLYHTSPRISTQQEDDNTLQTLETLHIFVQLVSYINFIELLFLSIHDFRYWMSTPYPLWMILNYVLGI